MKELSLQLSAQSGASQSPSSKIHLLVPQNALRLQLRQKMMRQGSRHPQSFPQLFPARGHT
jgi:hypothetical protein